MHISIYVYIYSLLYLYGGREKCTCAMHVTTWQRPLHMVSESLLTTGLALPISSGPSAGNNIRPPALASSLEKHMAWEAREACTMENWASRRGVFWICAESQGSLILAHSLCLLVPMRRTLKTRGVYNRGTLVAGKSLDSPEKSNREKRSKKPKTCPKAPAKTNFDVFGQLLPIWTHCYPASNPVHRMPMTISERLSRTPTAWRWRSDRKGRVDKVIKSLSCTTIYRSDQQKTRFVNMSLIGLNLKP